MAQKRRSIVIVIINTCPRHQSILVLFAACCKCETHSRNPEDTHTKDDDDDDDGDDDGDDDDDVIICIHNGIES